MSCVKAEATPTTAQSQRQNRRIENPRPQQVLPACSRNGYRYDPDHRDSREADPNPCKTDF
jgi:hypothetical protein